PVAPGAMAPGVAGAGAGAGAGGAGVPGFAAVPPGAGFAAAPLLWPCAPKKAANGLAANFSALTPDWRIASAIEAPIVFRVISVPRCTSMAWMLPRSMVRFRFSQD